MSEGVRSHRLSPWVWGVSAALAAALAFEGRQADFSYLAVEGHSFDGLDLGDVHAMGFDSAILNRAELIEARIEDSSFRGAERLGTVFPDGFSQDS